MLGIMSPLSLRFHSMLRNWIPTRFLICKLRQGVKWCIADCLTEFDSRPWSLQFCSSSLFLPRRTSVLPNLLSSCLRDIFSLAQFRLKRPTVVLPMHTASVLIRDMASLGTHGTFSTFWHGIVWYTRGASCFVPSAPSVCGIHEVVELYVSYVSTCKQHSAYFT